MVWELLELPQVERVTGDMRAYAMVQWDAEGEGSIKKPTGWMTNSECLAKAVGKRCP